MDSLFMTPLQKRKKIQQLLIENQEKSMTTSQMETMMKSEAAGQYGEQLETDEESAHSVPENMRELELKEISNGDVTSVHISDHLEGGHDGSSGSNDDEGEESDDESEEDEEEDCRDSSEHSSDCSEEEEEGENEEDDGGSEKFWNSEQLEILTSALPSFHFLPRTTMDKVVTELKVEN